MSWYIRPLPGDDVFVVKKAAIDYFRMDIDSFREPRVALIDANEAEQIRASVDEREIEVVRVGPKTWEMKQPIAQRADRQRVEYVGAHRSAQSLRICRGCSYRFSEWGLDRLLTAFRFQ